MLIAAIADIHGNLPALEAVLADARQQGVDKIICLGDIPTVGPSPKETLELVQQECSSVLQGNHELYLLGKGMPDGWANCPSFASMRWSQQQLSAEQLEYVANLPLEHLEQPLPDLLVHFLHASPANQFAGIWATSSSESIQKVMNGLDNRLLVFGHVHRQFLRKWSNTTLISVGSVGMPLENEPCAQYAILKFQDGKWAVEFRSVRYSLERLEQLFETSGLKGLENQVVDLFRFQYQTGIHVAAGYFNGLRGLAEKLNVPVAEVFDTYPLPTEVQQWLNEGSREF